MFTLPLGLDWVTRAEIIRAGGGTFKTFDRFAQFQESQGKSLTETERTTRTTNDGNDVRGVLQFPSSRRYSEVSNASVGVPAMSHEYSRAT